MTATSTSTTRPTPSIKYPSDLTSLVHIPSTTPTPIPKSVYDRAVAALEADTVNGHRQAYLILYEATGNQAFLDNLFIATRSGTIGGVAWNANQQILEKYPVEYPRDPITGAPSISEFSYLVGKSNLAAIKAGVQPDGRYLVPSEKDLHLQADHGAWITQDLSINKKLDDLYRVSPPGYLAGIDSCTASVAGRVISSLDVGELKVGSSLVIGACTALAASANPEANQIAMTALSRTNTQTAVAGAKDAANTGKVWVGKNLYDTAAELRSKGVDFTVERVRDTSIIKDSNGVIQGAWTDRMVQDTTFQRAMKVQQDNGLRTLEEGYQKYFQDLGGAKDAVEQKLPSIKNIQGYKISQADSLGEALADLGRPDAPLLAALDSDTVYDVGSLDHPLAGYAGDTGYKSRATAWNESFAKDFPDAKVAYVQDPNSASTSFIPVVVDKTGSIIGYVSIDKNTREVTVQLGAADQFTSSNNGVITHNNTAPEWLAKVQAEGGSLFGGNPEDLLANADIISSDFEEMSWSEDGNTQITEHFDNHGVVEWEEVVETNADDSYIETTTTPDGKTVSKSYDTEGQLAGTITDTPDGHGGFNRTISPVVDGKTVEVDQHIDANKLAEDTDHDGEAIIAARDSGSLRQLVTAGDATNATGWRDYLPKTDRTSYEGAPSNAPFACRRPKGLQALRRLARAAPASVRQSSCLPCSALIAPPRAGGAETRARRCGSWCALAQLG